MTDWSQERPSSSGVASMLRSSGREHHYGPMASSARRFAEPSLFHNIAATITFRDRLRYFAPIRMPAERFQHAAASRKPPIIHIAGANEPLSARHLDRPRHRPVGNYCCGGCPSVHSASRTAWMCAPKVAADCGADYCRPGSLDRSEMLTACYRATTKTDSAKCSFERRSAQMRLRIDDLIEARHRFRAGCKRMNPRHRYRCP